MALLLVRIAEFMAKMLAKLSLFVLPVVAVIESVTGMLADLLVNFASFLSSQMMFSNLNFSAVAEVSGLVNHFFALSETLAMSLAYFTMFSALLLFRWIKSFIPTVAN
ncbi:MAG: hypothetical protein QM496_05690 [Verrucomicrobiota bacterium]